MELQCSEQDQLGQKGIKLIGYSFTLVVLAYLIDFTFNPHNSVCEEVYHWYTWVFFVFQSLFLLLVPLTCYIASKKVDFFKILMLIYTIGAIGNLYDDVFGNSSVKDVSEITVLVIGLIYNIKNYGKV